MFYHVPDRARALSEISRVLMPDGTFYAATNGSGHLQELRKLKERFGLPTASSLSTKGFTLENGFEQLTPWFGEVSMARYEDSLCVTETKPLIAYIRSKVGSSDEVNDKLLSMAQHIERQLAHSGSIATRKSTGIFTARRPVRRSS